VLAVLGLPRLLARPTQFMVPTRRFHDAMVLDAFGSGSYASKGLAKVRTMILCLFRAVNRLVKECPMAALRVLLICNLLP